MDVKTIPTARYPYGNRPTVRILPRLADRQNSLFNSLLRLALAFQLVKFVAARPSPANHRSTKGTVLLHTVNPGVAAVNQDKHHQRHLTILTILPRIRDHEGLQSAVSTVWTV